MRLALFQPDMPGNVGTLIRTAACLGLPVDVIEPCGFPFGQAALRRSGMDYVEDADLTIHADWNAFHEATTGRLVLLTTSARYTHLETRYEAGDVLIVGQESSGVPDHVHDAASLRVRVPMRPGLRSLNVAIAASIVAGEALRQTGGFAA